MFGMHHRKQDVRIWCMVEMMGRLFSTISSLAIRFAAPSRMQLHKKTSKGQASLVFSAAVCAVAQLPTSQLMFTFIGALVYCILQALNRELHRPETYKTKALPHMVTSTRYSSLPWRRTAKSGPNESCTMTKSEVRMPSSMPVQAPKFSSVGWDAEVEELVANITPTPESEEVVDRLRCVVQQSIMRILPSAHVLAFASGDLTRRKAFGVAVPDLDIIILFDNAMLMERIMGRWSTCAGSCDERRLQKSAIRLCIDQLVSTAGFKFRRSAFKGHEPKVTLLAPTAPQLMGSAVPIDLCVNSLTPIYNAAILAESGWIDARAKSLLLLVKRWAKDRAVCHASKGHLSPYLWSLLTVFFLQVGVSSAGSILPPLTDYSTFSGLSSDPSNAAGYLANKIQEFKRASRPISSKNLLKSSTGALFKEFIKFYSTDFSWRNEAICVRTGRRETPGRHFPLHIISDDTGKTDIGPSIEDPFQQNCNLGCCMTSSSLCRLHQELARAQSLCCSGSSLSELLDPWMPPGEGRLNTEQ